jgi:hypothetical protein
MSDDRLYRALRMLRTRELTGRRYRRTKEDNERLRETLHQAGDLCNRTPEQLIRQIRALTKDHV